MKKKIVLALSLLGSLGLYAQTGIGVEIPTEMLDVNGKVRIRNQEGLPNNNLKELYADANGVLGTFTTVITPQFTLANSTIDFKPNNGSADFNGGKPVLYTFDSSQFTYNYLNLSINSGFLKINEKGYYNYILNINLYIETANANELVYGIAYLEYSKDNGLSWSIASAIDFQITGNTALNGGAIQNIFIAPTIVLHNKNELVRLSLKRQKSIDETSFLGQGVTNIKFNNEPDIPSYNLTIKKI